MSKNIYMITYTITNTHNRKILGVSQKRRHLFKNKTIWRGYILMICQVSGSPSKGGGQIGDSSALFYCLETPGKDQAQRSHSDFLHPPVDTLKVHSGLNSTHLFQVQSQSSNQDPMEQQDLSQEQGVAPVITSISQGPHVAQKPNMADFLSESVKEFDASRDETLVHDYSNTYRFKDQWQAPKPPCTDFSESSKMVGILQWSAKQSIGNHPMERSEMGDILPTQDPTPLITQGEVLELPSTNQNPNRALPSLSRIAVAVLAALSAEDQARFFITPAEFKDSEIGDALPTQNPTPLITQGEVLELPSTNQNPNRALPSLSRIAVAVLAALSAEDQARFFITPAEFNDSKMGDALPTQAYDALTTQKEVLELPTTNQNLNRALPSLSRIAVAVLAALSAEDQERFFITPAEFNDSKMGDALPTQAYDALTTQKEVLELTNESSNRTWPSLSSISVAVLAAI